jgi:hypothetical protein
MLTSPLLLLLLLLMPPPPTIVSFIIPAFAPKRPPLIATGWMPLLP